MSNLICPTCGFNNIDCGKAGYKTDREIELEKENKRLRDGAASIARGQALVDELGDYEAIIEHIKELNKKLDIAVKAFEEIELYRYDVNDIDQEDWFKIATYMAEIAEKSLEKISEVKK